MARCDIEILGQLPVQQSLWGDIELNLDSEANLAAAAYSLCLGCGAEPSQSDVRLWKSSGKPAFFGDVTLSFLASQITQGLDPLGDAFCSLRSPETRRDAGATYTPPAIVEAMVQWAAVQDHPQRVIDPGCGSARFLIAAGRKFEKAQLVGVETDALAALIARANLAVAGFADRADIIQKDFRKFDEKIAGRSLYIGNPPYVRHHKISAQWKKWLSERAAALGYPASGLAGLHVHFILATAIHAQSGDLGAFITAAEWLDVNYGAIVRKLFLKELGGTGITVVEPTAQPFPDAASTAAITTFKIASKASYFSFRRVAKLAELSELGAGKRIDRDRLESSMRWSYLSNRVRKPPQGFVELGEICRVHRGQVTGANGVWIAGGHSEGLPTSVLFRSITRAREIIAAAGTLDDSTPLRHIIDIPAELDVLPADERRIVDAFIKRAKAMCAHCGYVANHRKAWWAVGLRSPAPIISTYMARRSPAFVLNKTGARHINVAHGLYPRVELSEDRKIALVKFLQQNISQKSGRTYAGGLTKFEPREMERVFVPAPEMLSLGAHA